MKLKHYHACQQCKVIHHCKKCGRCGAAFYCGVDCQRADVNHRENCVPQTFPKFEIKARARDLMRRVEQDRRVSHALYQKERVEDVLQWCQYIQVDQLPNGMKIDCQPWNDLIGVPPDKLPTRSVLFVLRFETGETHAVAASDLSTPVPQLDSEFVSTQFLKDLNQIADFASTRIPDTDSFTPTKPKFGAAKPRYQRNRRRQRRRK